MFANRRLDLVELPEAIGQPQAVLYPGQRLVLQPVEHLWRQLIEAQQLLGQHGHQDQEQGQQDEGEQAEHHHHTPGA
ncbi:hypothetical protein D3C76_1572940 [compost metagenome]